MSGGLMILTSEVSQVLLTGGEHHAVDLGARPSTGQRDFLIDLRKPRAEPADGPLQGRVLADEGSFPAEVPSRVVPVLNV